jgi:hypothetical protein
MSSLHAVTRVTIVTWFTHAVSCSFIAVTGILLVTSTTFTCGAIQEIGTICLVGSKKITTKNIISKAEKTYIIYIVNYFLARIIFLFNIHVEIHKVDHVYLDIVERMWACKVA